MALTSSSNRVVATGDSVTKTFYFKLTGGTHGTDEHE
jgi:hypothetical protein